MTTQQMREVTKDEFYGIIMTKKLNVHPKIEGHYPYTSRFLFPSGKEFGRIEPVIKKPADRFNPKERYLVMED